MDEVMTAADATTSSSPSMAAAIPSNLALLAALLACALAQFLKLFTTWYKEKRWDSKKMLDSGGMPSSHSATVTALAVAVGLEDGTGGPAFAIAFVLACIVMYDASGVRLHAGRQAELLNQIVCELPPEHPLSSVRPLRDSLGHTPLQNGDAANFSIYIHSEPGFVFDEPTTRSAFFHGRQLNNSIQVGWGESSMIEAERILLQEALRDPANQRFVLLSDSCVPLYNFSYIYNYIISSPKSFVDSFVDGHAFRYDPKMAPTIPKERWRKGSQWIALVRRHAEIIVNDKTVFPVFRKFCKRWPPGDLKWRRKLLAFNFDIKYILQTFEQKRNCIPDEHYVQTLLAISGLEDELERRALTYTSWNQSAVGSKKRSWHPIKFDFADAGPQKIREIKDIDHVYDESEGQTEFCRANSKVAPCYLFARKFTLGAAVRIMREGVVGPYDVPSKPNIY